MRYLNCDCKDVVLRYRAVMRYLYCDCKDVVFPNSRVGCSMSLILLTVAIGVTVLSHYSRVCLLVPKMQDLVMQF